MAAYGSELSRLVDELNRSTAAARTGEGTSIDRLLALAVQRGASDVILVAGSGIALRVKGSLTQPGGKPLSSEELRSLLLPLLTARQAEELETNKSLDFCFVRGSIGRPVRVVKTSPVSVHPEASRSRSASWLEGDDVPAVPSLRLSRCQAAPCVTCFQACASRRHGASPAARRLRRP